MTIRFIDLFAGIGGFHAAGSAFGWKCVFANEIDPAAAAVYERNWGLDPLGDIQAFTRTKKSKLIPDHDVLFAGFPCQPFSKSGKQLGMDEDRGSLFHDIAEVIVKKKPSLVVLENVRNLAGPRHFHEWDFIIRKLRELGYRVSSKPFIVSPHRIPPKYGGTPQARERVFIVATRLASRRDKLIMDDSPLRFPSVFESWDPSKWNLIENLQLRNDPKDFLKFRLSQDEIEVLEIWDELIRDLFEARDGERLPGFPMWSDLWGKKPIYSREKNAPDWKIDFEEKNLQFYKEYRSVIDKWFSDNPSIRNFIPSKRKFEWQAQDNSSIWEGLIHFRPSGIRVKRATYVPALVAITQTSIIGPFKRRLTPSEAALLQGLPRNFDFGDQRDSMSYKQLGNGVSVGAVYQVVRAALERDGEILEETNAALYRSIRKSPEAPQDKINAEIFINRRGNKRGITRQ